METRKKRFEELNISRDELKTIGEALKTEEFRNLLAEYCKEVTDPENQKVYQKEITELERQRGVDVTFINPDPGFVIKTSADGKQKAFINVSKSPNVGQPKPGNRDERGFQWSIPYSIVPPREDLDRQKNLCMVIDVVFHPYTLYLASLRKPFRDVVVQTALDAVEQHCHVTLDRSNLKFPKLNFKGLSRGAVVRKKNPNFVASEEDKEFLSQIPNPYEEGNYFTEKKALSPPKDDKVALTPGYTKPNFSIKYRNYIDMQDFTFDANCKANAAIPKEVLVSIELPLLKSSSEPSLKLDIAETTISLTCEKPKYKLNLTLPYAVDENSGEAKFEKDTRKLVLTLPVKLPCHVAKDILLEDSGVESDPGGRVDYDADSDEVPSKTSDNSSEEDDHIEVCPSEVSEYGYRTSNNMQPSVCDLFLKEDLHYSLPHFTCNSFDNTFALTLHVKNVDEKTIHYRVLPENRGLHLAFASLGGGMFPQHYALCVMFPPGTSIGENSVVIEAWDNNVISQFKLEHSQGLPDKYYVGVDTHDLKPAPMTELLQAEMAVNNLQEETDNQVKDNVFIDVQHESVEEVVIELTPISESKSETTLSTATEREISSTDGSKGDTKDKAGERSPPNRPSKGALSKNRKVHTRGLSESSGNDWVQTNIVRGILKRPSRSLSESNLDEYVLSDIPSSAIGSEECIASENCGSCTEDHVTQKKTVRFSDHIGKKIFRVNSSILGKKNVNKEKRKKRARARRASEGDNSENETDHINGIIKNKSKNQRVSESPRLSESTEDEEHYLKRLESSEEERDKTDKENKMKRSRKRRRAKSGGRC